MPLSLIHTPESNTASPQIFFVILTAGLEDPAFKLGNIGILNTAAQVSKSNTMICLESQDVFSGYTSVPWWPRSCSR